MARVPSLTFALLAASCAGSPSGGSVAPPHEAPRYPSLRSRFLGGAQLLPDSPSENLHRGGDGQRGIAGGIRFVRIPDGSTLVAQDRLPQTPTQWVQVPDRLGGGYLFALGPMLWRADEWLGPARPLASYSAALSRIIVGLDRVHLQLHGGGLQPVDPQTGELQDVGAWPRAPLVASFVAADGWRALALTDFAGVLATYNAGASWTPVPLPINAREVSTRDGSLLVTGTDRTGSLHTYDLSEGRIPPPLAAPSREPPPSRSLVHDSDNGFASPLRRLGPHPLATAMAEGIPLADETALVARDGTLIRVRLRDGSLLEAHPHAFDLAQAHCQGVPLVSPLGPGVSSAQGFVCSQGLEATWVYGFEEGAGRLLPLRKFTGPRTVFPSGNGGLVVRGPCDGSAPSEKDLLAKVCVYPPGGPFEESELPVASGQKRVVVLADKSIHVVLAPSGPTSPGELWRNPFPRGPWRRVPLSYPPLDVDRAHEIVRGVWIEGWQERAPGLVGGYVETSGTYVGVTVEPTGNVRVGPLVRDLGRVVLGGAFGLGWSPSRRGYETTDGGMTWTPLELPEPLAGPLQSRVSACGPMGCVLGGWIRVGFQSKPPGPLPPPRSAFRPRMVTAAPLDLACETTSVAPLEASRLDGQEARVIAATPAPDAAKRNTPSNDDPPPFYARPAPSLRVEDVGVGIEVFDLLPHTVRSGPLGRVYTWGPRNGDWTSTSKWVARWLSPYDPSDRVRTTGVGPAAFTSLDHAKRVLGQGLMGPVFWTMAMGEQPSSALLLGRHGKPDQTEVLSLEEGGPIETIHRLGGDPFPEIDGAVQVGRRWFLSSRESPGELSSSVLWIVESGTAREVARVPRLLAPDQRATLVRLARRSDLRAVAWVVDGRGSGERNNYARWAIPVDLTSMAVGTPEPLDPLDGTAREPEVCQGHERGWVFDTPWNTPSLPVVVGTESLGPLQNPYARVRASPSGLCLEQLTGAMDWMAPSRWKALAASSRSKPNAETDGPRIPVTVASPTSRLLLQCVPGKSRKK